MDCLKNPCFTEINIHIIAFISSHSRHFLDLNAKFWASFNYWLGYRGRKSLEQSNYQIDSWLRAPVCWFHFSGTNTMDYWHRIWPSTFFPSSLLNARQIYRYLTPQMNYPLCYQITASFLTNKHNYIGAKSFLNIWIGM